MVCGVAANCLPCNDVSQPKPRLPLNNKDFITELARRTGHSTKETNRLVSALLSCMTERWEEGSTIAIQGFGTFEVKTKAERISVNPITKSRLLIPPKRVLSFRPSTQLKDKFK